MKEACEAFQIPVTGGNVSFYNQSEQGEPILPTPVIGMVGVLDNPDWHIGLAFRSVGDVIYEVGFSSDSIDGSQYLIGYHGVRCSPPPPFQLQDEIQLQKALRKLFQRQERPVVSAHDISEGGLWIALLESAIIGGLGFDITLPSIGRRDGWLFGEGAPRVVMSVSPEDTAAFENYWMYWKIPFRRLGTVTSGDVVVDGEGWGTIARWRAYYEQAF